MRNNSERRAKAWEIVTALLSPSPFLPIFSLFSLTPLFPMETLQINLHQKCLPYRLSKEVTKNGMNQVSILWRFYGSLSGNNVTQGMVRALTSHQCVLGSNPGVDARYLG